MTCSSSLFLSAFLFFSYMNLSHSIFSTMTVTKYSFSVFNCVLCISSVFISLVVLCISSTHVVKVMKTLSQFACVYSICVCFLSCILTLIVETAGVAAALF